MGGSGQGGGGSGGSGGGTGQAIEAPSETWTWVDFPDSACANGAPTGIGVNLSDKSKKVLIFLQGGGACWNDLTCYTVKSASFIESGYGSADFSKDAKTILNASVFSRTNANNPFKDASYVFVPYCTGDIHAGDNDPVYGMKKTLHYGRRNIEAYLKRLTPTFAGADRVWLSGSSAGGYGAAFNWWRFQDAFGKTRVDLIDDSGPPLPPPYLSAGLESAWRTAWKLDGAFPPDCDTCASGFDGLFTYYGKKYTGDHRAALLSYTQDNVISTFYGIKGAEFEMGLEALRANNLVPNKIGYFFLTGANHVLIGALDQKAQPSGPTLLEWITQMATDDPNWAPQMP